MKIPKYIEKALERRRACAEMLNDYHCVILNFCNDNNIDVLDLETEYGCMLTTEPHKYYELWKKRIESKE